MPDHLSVQMAGRRAANLLTEDFGRFTFDPPWGSHYALAAAEQEFAVKGLFDGEIPQPSSITIGAAAVGTSYSLTPSSRTITEGNTSITFTISRSGNMPAETIYASTLFDTARSPGDYDGLINFAVSFSSGQTSRTFTVSINEDSLVESTEHFRVMIGDDPADQSAQALDISDIYITDDDAPVSTSYSLTPSSTTVTEGNTSITFTITRSGGKPAETIYASTLFDTASSPGDYDGLVNYAVSFSDGETSETFTVSINEDSLVEATERFRVMIGDDLSDQSAQALDISDVFITDDDGSAPGFTITPASTSVTEGSQLVFTITRTGNLTDQTVFFSTWQDTATFDEQDYSLVGGGEPLDVPIHFAAGDATETVTLAILQDNQPDAGERFRAIVQGNPPASDPAINLAQTAFITINEAGTPPPVADDFRDEANDASSPLGTLSESEPAEEGIIGPADANDTHGDKDVFRLTLTQGQTYLFTMTGATVNGVGPLSQSIFTMRSGSNFNAILATSSEGPNAQMEFEATTGGTYYIRTGAGGPNHTTIQGGYRISLQPVSDGTVDISSQLQASGSYTKTGHVGGGDPLDVFTLTAPADGSLTVDLTGLSADIDIRILNEQGGVLDHSSLNGTASEHVSITLAAGERVQIEVDPYGAAQSVYNLNIHFGATPEPPVTPLPSSDHLIGYHLLRTLAEFAAAAYSDDSGDEARDHLARIDGWRFYNASFASTSSAETALSLMMGTSGFYERGAAAAVVARASDAIVISFRGTNSPLDVLHWPLMQAHFSLFSDLIDATDRLINEDSTIRHVFVTGHSLGAAMVDLYMSMNNHSSDNFRAITYAHPDVIDIILGGLPSDGDERIISFHNSTDPIQIPDIPGGLDPGIRNIISYSGATVFAHDKQLYIYGTDFLARSGVDDRVIGLGLNGLGHNHFLIPNPGTGTANTLVSRAGSLLMVGGDGSDLYDTIPHWRPGDTIIEHGGSADVLRLRDAPLGFGNLNWFQGTVWLSSPNGRDLYVHPVRFDGANLPYIRIYNHFTEPGRVEAIQWEGQSVILPSSPANIDLWNSSRYRSVSLADVQYVEAPDGTISRSISATGGSGTTDTVSFGGLRNSITASLVDGVAGILDTLNPFDLAPSGAASATSPAGSIPVDIADMENVTGSSVDDDITGSDLANYLGGGDGNDHLVGLAGNDMLDGGSGDDRINGGSGADGMIGGAGDDQFRVDDLGDRIFEAIGEGRDTVFVDTTYALTADAEVEIIATTNFDGLTPINLTGNAFAQEIWGNAGANVLNGGGGADWLFGGAGNDRLLGGEGADNLYGDAGADLFVYGAIGDSTVASFDTIRDFQHGIDRIDVSALGVINNYGFVLGSDGWTTLTVATATGNLVVRVQGVVTIADLVIPYGPPVTRIGTSGNDVLTGGTGADYLIGLAGNDRLYGGSGAPNQLQGGIGDDYYYVSAAKDSIVEFAGEGTDRIYASVSYVLGAGRSIESIFAAGPTATTPLNLTGNALGQVIWGNAGANILTGGGGVDTLIGGGGNDRLHGNADAASTLVGGTGDDFYYVSNRGDSTLEYAGEGNDRIYAGVSYVLGAGRSIESIFAINPTSTAALNLTGNALGQVIWGNAGTNILIGGGGADTLIGGAGNDTLYGNADANSTMQGGTGDDWYYVSRTGDSLVELAGQGHDRILSNVSYVLGAGREVEMLLTRSQAGTAALNLTGNEFGQTVLGNNGANTLSGGGGADQLGGYGGADILLGGDGADQLNGGTGNDILNGGAGADRFIFADALGPANVDRIQDFAGGLDRIFIDNAVFAGLANGALAAGAFRTGSAALDADDRIIYNPVSGALLFDADGNGAGAAVQFAVLSGAPALAASDFTVI